jgi:hypothetical protein
MAMTTTRRRLLAAGAASTGLLLMGGGLRFFALGYALRPGEVALGMSVKELCVVRSIVDALLPAAAQMPSGVDLGVHQRIDEELWAQPAATRADLRAAIQLIEHSPPAFGAFGRLSRLDREARARVYAKLVAGDVDVVVQAAAALKQLAHIFYYGDPRTWAGIGYDGPLVRTPKPPPSALGYARLRDAVLGVAS